ncbi:MAG: Gfo/Idh/MocA family oxidoreductase [Gammaproteobacteria bacterium]|nr:Gfo/Idh/MocA family oxidoreductase [Gammaproteobacteria bacterium]MDH5345155.1 Gfo/Idh/MocA family oxidoreductase [Gammaproteobacteria bacterium]
MANDPQNPDNPDRRTFLKSAGLVPAAMLLESGTASGADVPGTGGETMMGHVAPRLDTVRIGVIGTGIRGSMHLELLAAIDGAQITAVCDSYPPALERAKALLDGLGLPVPPAYGDGDYAWRDLLARDDVDAVLIATPWSWHTPMAVEAMQAGKQALVEVPAALTIEECWQLVETSESTRMNCMMLENVCYGREELMALNMVRQGVLGELLHGEAAYIHELRWQMKEIDEGTGSWRTAWHAKRNANLYPTHGLGPIAQYMDVNRGDRFDFLSSVSSPALGRQLYAQREFPADHERNRLRYICGDMNTSLIRTVRGRTIMVQHDTTTPRPYTRHNLIQGTNGVYARYPDRIALESEGDYHEWQHDMADWYAHYDHPLWKKLAADATASEAHGGMDYVMLWRIVYCLRNGVPLDQNVYDAAAWSAVTPLSEASNADRGNSRDFPDFTRGVWQHAAALNIA